MQQNPGCFQPTMFIQHVQKPGRIVISFGTRPFIDSEHFLIKSRYHTNASSAICTYPRHSRRPMIIVVSRLNKHSVYYRTPEWPNQSGPRSPERVFQNTYFLECVFSSSKRPPLEGHGQMNRGSKTLLLRTGSEARQLRLILPKMAPLHPARRLQLLAIT